VVAVAALARRVILTGREISGRRDVGCTVSIGGFVPKSHTPFQWVAQADAETIDRRLGLLKQAIRDDRQCGRAITLRYGEGRPAQLEGLLARGDRRVGPVIEAVWRKGQMFDGWREHANLDLWEQTADQVLAEAGVSWTWYTTRERTRTEVLPWQHLDFGLKKGWLWRDYQASLRAETLQDCRGPMVTQPAIEHQPTVDGDPPTVDRPCTLCGVCPAFDVDLELAAAPEFDSGRFVDCREICPKSAKQADFEQISRQSTRSVPVPDRCDRTARATVTKGSDDA